jgi:hypothetical protein
MKAILTRQNVDGSYDTVGMNNRTIVGPYKLLRTVNQRAREFGGRRVQIELFDHSVYVNPYHTYVLGV